MTIIETTSKVVFVTDNLAVVFKVAILTLITDNSTLLLEITNVLLLLNYIPYIYHLV